MSRVVVLSTGGTIASRSGADGVTRAEDPADALLARTRVPEGVEVSGVDVDRRGSYALAVADMVRLAGQAAGALADPSTTGVVVTHGTDTLEASAFLAQLLHADPRPVVFTGAMRAGDVPDSDGPRNLADAIAVAASPAARGLGVLVAFDGLVLPAAGTAKVHTVGTAAFSSPDAGPLGHVHDGRLSLHRGADPALGERLRATGLTGASPVVDDVRVDVVPSYPGTDATGLRAAQQAGARGVVLEGTGAGNANPLVVEGVRELVGAGVVVALTTRVPAGPVAPVYGNGGGADLVAAGAVPVTWLRAPQALVLLACLLATGDADRARDALGRW